MVDYIWAERQEYIFDNYFFIFVDSASCFALQPSRAQDTEHNNPNAGRGVKPSLKMHHPAVNPNKAGNQLQYKADTKPVTLKMVEKPCARVELNSYMIASDLLPVVRMVAGCSSPP